MGHVLNFIKNNRPTDKPAQKTDRVNRCIVTLKWIVKTDVVDLRAGLMSEERCFSRLARACDQDGRKASQGLL